MEMARRRLFTACTVIALIGACIANDAKADKAYYEIQDVLAEDPGPAPDSSGIRKIVAGSFLTVAAVVTGLLVLRKGDSKSGGARFKTSNLMISLLVLLLASVAVFVVITRLNPDKNYQQWKEKHEAYERGEVVGQKRVLVAPSGGGNRWEHELEDTPKDGSAAE